MAVDTSIDERERAPKSPRHALGGHAHPTLLTVAAVCVIAAALAVVGWARMNTVPAGRTYAVVPAPAPVPPSPAGAEPLVPLLPPPGRAPSTSATHPARPARTPPSSAVPSPSGRPRATPGGAITGYLGKCLRGPATDGLPVAMAGCDGSAGERWTLNADGTMRTLGLCLEVNGGEVTDGARVQMGTCDGTAGQQWQATAGRDIVNPRSHRCLDVVDFNSRDGAALQIWTCVGGANQKWAVPAA